LQQSRAHPVGSPNIHRKGIKKTVDFFVSPGILGVSGMTASAITMIILAVYPAVVGGCHLARGITNGPTPGSLLQLIRLSSRPPCNGLATCPLSQVPALAAGRSALRGFG